MLYFIAILPPEPLRSKLSAQKQLIAEQYKTYKALNSPPHITLFPPFQKDASQEEYFLQTLEKEMSTVQSFDITLNGHGAFPPRVVYVAVELTDALQQLYEQIKLLVREVWEVKEERYGGRPYHPHLTLAFKDLSKGAFHKVWEVYRDTSFEATFTVCKVALLKHDGKVWQVLKEIGLKKE
ncbi:2'-5' RNA ligase family protein [Algivirga pacifica]|uniref:2'-5' RNA ligase family protein n=1 Tax=Algivirga pacifica TaxID=1162670 RepID=A0ABP9D984_9BACT